MVGDFCVAVLAGTFELLLRHCDDAIAEVLDIFRDPKLNEFLEPREELWHVTPVHVQ